MQYFKNSLRLTIPVFIRRTAHMSPEDFPKITAGSKATSERNICYIV